MKCFFISGCCLLFFAFSLYGQKELVLEKGTVSYTSSVNIYVKFTTTEYINKGDTLFFQKGEQMLPGLVVKDKSSTSCVCSSLLTEKPKVGDAFIAKCLIEKKVVKPKEKPVKVAPSLLQDSSAVQAPLVKAPSPDDRGYYQSLQKSQQIKGRVSIASYSSIYGGDATHRMRYTFTLQGNNIKKSRFSTDNYISFLHTIGDADRRTTLSDALKVYALSVKYDIDKASSISLGRKINYRISSMGAIDGLQYERALHKRWLLGVLGGWRPDYTNYSFNTKLLQAGGYLSYTTGKTNANQESTLAFVEQHNGRQIDRRFAYFQHNNSLMKNLNLFGSFEIDLYQAINGRITHQPSLTNLLLSLRYKLSKKVGLSLAYDNRKNIIYYESYKTFIDRLIDDETRQGLRLGGTWHVSKLIGCGINASRRFQKSNINLSENINAFLNFSSLPWTSGTASLSANILKTNYLDSKMYGIRISKGIVPRKLQADLHYRWVDYQYKTFESQVQQQIAGLDVSWYITRKLALYWYYEGTYQSKNRPFNRLNCRIIQRF